MLDLHALSSGGSTGGLGAIGTILLGGDGQATAGVPVLPDARLIGWGEMSTVADTIQEARFVSQDMVDPVNGEDFNPNTGSLLGAFHKNTNILFKSGARTFQIDQNTGAANCMAYTIDHYSKGTTVKGSYFPEKSILAATTSGAITAITWQTVAFAPATPIPNGKYAILGASVGALTNYGLLRFEHADFQGLRPGFPVLDRTNVTAAAGFQVVNNDPIWAHPLYQFVYLSEISGLPMCPVFNVTSAGSGLRIWTTAITADTPIIQLNIQKLD